MAYDLATISKNEPLPNGGILLTVRFTGPGAEVPVERTINLGRDTTAQSVKQWAQDQVAELNSQRTLGQVAGLQVAQTINLTAISPPAPTAKQLFAIEVQKLRQMQNATALGMTGPFDLAAQKASVQTTLTANPSFIDVF